jgi:transcriptional regulator with XRE-family HTH domain
MTNNELATALGVTPAVTSRYANGKIMPSKNRIKEIAAITGVTPMQCAAMYLVANIKAQYGKEVLLLVQMFGLNDVDIAAAAHIITRHKELGE